MLKGYVQMVHDLEKSMTNSSNSYFDTDFQAGESDCKAIRVMVKNSDPSRPQLLLDSLTLNKHFIFQTWDL